ncbi:hypothetical protein GOARA_091_00140 [Gordonia araii NBRC 100433]|uniref:Zinc finger CGNR domain-containing protein n=2 Tax=Gordonia araii TaxID=263909 RepID=G7H7S1_9ACTN|nr:hypothetical protein GOARA_091_00140 [Gordonia araii NBRC 100433]
MTGQWFTSPDGVRWFFDSGSLALDFGYTGDYGYDVSEWESLPDPPALDAWLTERFGRLASVPTAADFDRALALRSAVWAIAGSLADGQPAAPTAVDVVNEIAALPGPIPHLAGGTTPPPQLAVPTALSAIARDAIAVFGGDPARIRRCGADDCALIFYDGSRPGSRRWCSMRRCGNRAKVRNHRSRD